MNPPLDEEYFTWLYSQISSVKSRSRIRNHWALTRALYNKEFAWIVANDDNRAADGLDLRYEFLHESAIDYPDPNWIQLGCSVLEMLIGLSRRLSFDAEGEPRDWFWTLVRNLGLIGYNDHNWVGQAEDEVDLILERFIWRNYASDGNGGLFPLEHPRDDQREIEIWYQLQAYLLERQ